MHVLIIKLSSMGDIIHTLPALTDAANNISNIHFDWVIEKDFIQIPTWHPSVRQVLSVDLRKWLNNCFNLNYYKEYFHFKYKLQKFHYDAVIDVQGLIKTSILITNITLGKKHGLNYNSVREPFSSYFYDHKYVIKKHQHAIKRIRHLFAAIFKYSLPSYFGYYNIKNYFKKKLINLQHPYLVFLHSSSNTNKQWPEDYWRKIIKLIYNTGYKIKLPWYMQHEYLRAKRLTYEFNHVEILPKLKLTEISEQLINAKAIVSIDTGLSHLAAALDCPTLTLYGPTDPKLIGTYGFNQEQLYSCEGTMKSISVEHVWYKLKKIIQC